MSVRDGLKAKIDEAKQLVEELSELAEQASREDLTLKELWELSRRARRLKERVKKL